MLALKLLAALVFASATLGQSYIDFLKIKSRQGRTSNSIAANRKYIFIGSSFYRGTGSVAVYVNKPGYEFVKRLIVPDGVTKTFRALFGYSVACNDDYVVVGAKWNTGNYTRQGAVYVYKTSRADKWKYQKLEANFPGKKHGFGESVAISDSHEIVVGAPKATGRARKENFGIGPRAGAAYVFYRNNDGKWVLRQTLIPSGLQAYDYMGRSVSITTKYIAISANFAAVTVDPGNVYIFKKNTEGLWVEDTKLASPNPEKSGGFGGSVSLFSDSWGDKYGDTIVIGAKDENDMVGNAYVFAMADGKWTLKSQLTPKHSKKHNGFGTVVSIRENTVVVGTAYDDSGKSIHRGIGHVFKLVDGKWVESQTLDLKKEGYVNSVAIWDDKIYAGCGDGSYVFSIV